MFNAHYHSCAFTRFKFIKVINISSVYAWGVFTHTLKQIHLRVNHLSDGKTHIMSQKPHQCAQITPLNTTRTKTTPMRTNHPAKYHKTYKNWQIDKTYEQSKC